MNPARNTVSIREICFVSLSLQALSGSVTKARENDFGTCDKFLRKE